ncbi:MAG: accessory gene regulator B family protein [Clostridiaceae bacterium]|nr:accessory gene regulator B family protein [Clostridiaceae bacterium]
MIDKFCKYLTYKIRKKMPEVDDERAEIIMYGLQLIIGEIPKMFLMFGIGIILGIWWQTLLAFFLILPYRICSGGFHLKTHIGCFIGTTLNYCGNAFISTVYNFPNDIFKYISIFVVLIFGIIMISLYAPADTENLPILTKKERDRKKVLSYIVLIINMIIAIFINNQIISNIMIIGTFIQTISITKIAYKLTNNKYGYEEYIKANQTI